MDSARHGPNPLFTGVWFGFDPNDGSAGFIGVNSQFDVFFVDLNATGGCSQAGGGVYMGVVRSKDDGFEPNEFAGMAYDLETLTDTDGGGGGDGFVG